MANRTIGLVLDGNRNGNTEKLAETQVSIVSNDGWPELQSVKCAIVGLEFGNKIKKLQSTGLALIPVPKMLLPATLEQQPWFPVCFSFTSIQVNPSRILVFSQIPQAIIKSLQQSNDFLTQSSFRSEDFTPTNAATPRRQTKITTTRAFEPPQSKFGMNVQEKLSKTAKRTMFNQGSFGT